MVNGKAKTKTEYVRKRDKREKFIEQFGMEKFDSISKIDKSWSQLLDMDVPKRFAWIWAQFLRLWGTCEHDFGGNTVMTPRSILDYCECFKVSLSVYERQLCFRMRMWAQEEINKLNKEE